MPNKQHEYIPSTDLKDDRVAVQGSAPKHIISSIVSRCLDCNSVNSISNANDIAERALLNSIPHNGITCRGLYQGFGLTIAKMATAPMIETAVNSENITIKCTILSLSRVEEVSIGTTGRRVSLDLDEASKAARGSMKRNTYPNTMNGADTDDDDDDDDDVLFVVVFCSTNLNNGDNIAANKLNCITVRSVATSTSSIISIE